MDSLDQAVCFASHLICFLVQPKHPNVCRNHAAAVAFQFVSIYDMNMIYFSKNKPSSIQNLLTKGAGRFVQDR